MQKNNKGLIISMAALLIIAFFMPWLKAFIFSLNAWDLIFGRTSMLFDTPIKYLALGFPIFGAMIIYGVAFNNGNYPLPRRLLFLLPLVTIIVLSLLIISEAGEESENVFSLFAIGFWLTLIASIILPFLSGVTVKASAADARPTTTSTTTDSPLQTNAAPAFVQQTTTTQEPPVALGIAAPLSENESLNTETPHQSKLNSNAMNIFERAKNIIIAPVKEWNVIASETPDTGKIITGYVLPLAGLAAVAAFIGYALVGFNYLGFQIRGFNWGLYQAVSVLIGALIGVYLSAIVIDALAPSFGSEKNMGRSVQLVAYSYTPAWVGGLLMVFPTLGIIGTLFALYGFYLLYVGMPKLKKTPEDKQIGYFVVSLLVMIVVFVVVGMIVGRLLMSIFGLSYDAFQPSLFN